MSRYEEVDLTKLTTIPVEGRGTKVGATDLYRPARATESFTSFWDSLPDQLGARDLREVVSAVVASRVAGRPVVVLCGAHVLKVGLGPGLIDLVHRKLLTCVAFHGAGAIHDVELGLWGETSEDVAETLHEGRFGMARETASFVNGGAVDAAARKEGFGEALGRKLLEIDPATSERSVLAAAYRTGIPATVHVAIGTDVVHQHPDFNGAATGDASARDFRILAAHLLEAGGSTILNFGSAVVLPEVFLKAFSVARNLGADAAGMTTAVFDFIRHYRPTENVVRRPTLGVGRGHYLIGQHEILLPLFFQACLIESARAGGRPRARENNS